MASYSPVVFPCSSLLSTGLRVENATTVEEQTWVPQTNVNDEKYPIIVPMLSYDIATISEKMMDDDPEYKFAELTTQTPLRIYKIDPPFFLPCF